MLAVRDGREETVALLIEKGADVNATNDRGVSALHRAIAWPKIAELLISKGAKVDAADIQNQTALHYCARDPRAKIAATLIEKGANPNTAGIRGQTPMSLAA